MAKVLKLLSMESLVPSRDRILSQMGILADLAGTQHPIWAMTTMSAICFTYTLYAMRGQTEESHLEAVVLG